MEFNVKRPAWIEINLKNLEKNYNLIRQKIAKKTKIAAVVKADAYGHGAVEISKKLSELGADYFCVGSPEEGLELRKNGIKKEILVLAEILESQYSEITAGDLIQTVASKNTLYSLAEFADKNNKKIKIHLKIDTGMGRIGFLPAEFPKIYQQAKGMKNIEVKGIFSHFASADSENRKFALKQLAEFKKIKKTVKKIDSKTPEFHLANSAGIINLAQSNFDLVRPGIILYGLLPAKSMKNKVELEPLLTFKTRIVQIRKVPQNTPVSYGSTYRTKAEEKLAVLPIGYKDGYPRQLSNRGEVLIKGQRAAIRGKVCMGQIVVSIDHLENVELGDQVVLIGKQGNEEITAAEIAELAGTISYEVVCNLSDKLEKIYY